MEKRQLKIHSPTRRAQFEAFQIRLAAVFSSHPAARRGLPEARSFISLPVSRLLRTRISNKTLGRESSSQGRFT